jgi:uncharacterized protein (DUF58 family)
MSARDWDANPRIAVEWLELASLASGLGLIGLSLDGSTFQIASLPFFSLLLLGLGALLVLWGGRRIAAIVWALALRIVSPWGTTHYRLHFQREAYLYTLMLLVTGVGALLGGSNLLLLVFALMAGPFIVGGQVTLLVLRRLQVTRILPEFAVVGQGFPVRVRLTNRKPLLSAWMIVAADTVANFREVVRPAVLFTRVPPWGTRETMYVVRPSRRGRYRFGPLRVTCGFPLGLVARSFELGATQELIVYPRIGRLTTSWQELSRNGMRAAERVAAGIGICDEEFHRLREYRGGDNPRAIHWRTTARRNELMVREYLHHHDPDLWLVLDLWQPDRPTDEDLDRVEAAISLAATICAAQARVSGDVELHLEICGQERSRTAWGREAQPLSALLSQLALAEAGTAAELADALREARQSSDPETRRVLISTRPIEGELARALRERESGEAVGELLGYFQTIHCDAGSQSDYVCYDDEPGAIG